MIFTGQVIIVINLIHCPFRTYIPILLAIAEGCFNEEKGGEQDYFDFHL